MSDYIVNANKAFIYLKDNIDRFQKEAAIIDEAKCYLANFSNLDDFEYEDAYIYETGVGYNIVFDDEIINLEIEDKMIVDYKCI